jgi:hypothetical protein
MNQTGRRIVAGRPNLPDVLLDLPLGVEMGNAGVAFGPADRGIDIVSHPGLFGQVGQHRALRDLFLHPGFEGRGHGEHALHSLQRRPERRRIGEIALRHLGAFLRQPGRFGRVAGEGADLLAPAQQAPGHRPSLLSRGARD